MKLALTCLCVLLVLPGLAVAVDVTATGEGPSGTASRLDCDGVVCASQAPAVTPYGSLISFEGIDAGGFGDNRSADDFTVQCDGVQINRIHFWGSYDAEAYNCATNTFIGDPVSGFNIWVYEKTACADGTSPDLGTLVAEHLGVTAFTEEFLVCTATATSANFEYCLDLPAPVSVSLGSEYWLVIQAADWSDGGVTTAAARRWLWGRVERTPIGCMMALRGPDIGFPNWTPITTLGAPASDALFEVLGEVVTPTEEKSWGEVKGTYR